MKPAIYKVNPVVRWTATAVTLVLVLIVGRLLFQFAGILRQGARQYDMNLNLWMAVGKNPPDRAAINRLLDQGADPNYEDGGDFTDTDVAVGADNAAVVSLLLERGASLTKDPRALHRASEGGKADIVAILLAHGADIKARNYEGKTALKLAIDHRPGVKSAEQEAFDRTIRILKKAGTRE